MRTRLPILVVLVTLASGSALAATPVVNGDGQLLGASGIEVDGSFYDVEFLDGRCGLDFYPACYLNGDFPFMTSDAALLASQALLDQVFMDGPLGLFDTAPALTNGCENDEWCAVVTPFELTSGSSQWQSGLLRTVVANNYDESIEWLPTDFDDYLSTPDPALSDGSASRYATREAFGPTATYAVWTLVPEPGSALLMGLGLAGLAGRRR